MLDADTLDALGFGEQWDEWEHASIEVLKRSTHAERMRERYQPRTRKERRRVVSAAESRKRWREKQGEALRAAEAARKREARRRAKEAKRAA